MRIVELKGSVKLTGPFSFLCKNYKKSGQIFLTKVGFWPFLTNKSGQKKIKGLFNLLKDCLIFWSFLGYFSMKISALVKYPLLSLH